MYNERGWGWGGLAAGHKARPSVCMSTLPKSREEVAEQIVRRQVMADTSNADGGLGQIIQEAKKLFRQDKEEDEDDDEDDEEEEQDDEVTELTAKVYSGGEEVIPPR